MKKSRVFLSILLALLMLLTLSMVTACVDNNDPGNNPPPTPDKGTWALQNITIGGSYKTEYQLNEAFSADGLTVSATMKNTATMDTRIDNVTTTAVVDSSKFNSAMVGVYTITVSYTNTGVTRYAHYTVSVASYEPVVNGITMQKVQVDYDVPAGQQSVNVNVDDITVKAIDANGEEEETPLAADDYVLTYYKGGEKVEKLAEATKGAYTIQAERKSDGQKAFVVVYVFDPAVSIELKAGSTVTQGQALTNTMSADWLFTVTNRSGATNEITVDEVSLSIFNSLVPGNYSVKVTYNEYDAKGRPAAENGITTTVDYTITKVEGVVNQSYAVNFSQLATGTIAENTVVNEAGGIKIIPLLDSKTEASKSKISSDSKTSQDQTKSFANRFQFGGKSVAASGKIEVTVKGPSLITVYARTTSAGRGLGIYTDEKLTEQNHYTVLTSDIKAITCLADQAGKYYLAGPDGDINIYYVQVDTVLTGGDPKDSVELPTATEFAGITLDTKNVTTDFIKGGTFSAEGLVVYKTLYNPVTADIAKVLVAAEDYTVTIPNGSMDVQGKPTVTVTCQGKTATYTINVNSLVDGVNGIKVTLPATTIELDKEGDTITLSESDVTVKTDSGAAIVIGDEAGQCATLVIELYSVGETETKLNTLTVGAGTYKVKVIATYNNTANSGTTSFTDEITFTVKVKVNEPQKPTNFTLNPNDLYGDNTADVTITTATAWGDKAEVQPKTSGSKDVTIKSSTKKVTIDGTELTLHRIETQGSMGNDFSRGIKITLEGACTIRYWAMAGTSGTDLSDRYIKLVNSNNARVAAPAADETEDYLPFSNGTLVEKTITVTAADIAATANGVFYLGSGNSNVYIYYISIEYTSSTGSNTGTTTYNLDLAALATTDSTNLTQDNLTDDNAFLTKVTNGTLVYRTAASGCIEIKNDALSVTFAGTGTIKITVQSNGNSNKSALYLKDENGKYVSATYTANDAIAEVAQSDKGNVYTVLGQTAYEFTFTITEAGTYTIGTMNVNSETGRVTRIKAIQMIDTVGEVNA